MLSHQDLAVDLIRRTQYWVYDPIAKTFSPSKFSGYVAMDFPHYVVARGGASSGAKFDGGVTQRAITQVLGDYRSDHELAQELEAWASSIFYQDVLEGIAPDKWRFVRLPATGAGGLAALAGGWEGSEELVESVLELRRGPGRTVPELD
ncbi:MAG TPA: hypothetical protein VH165_08010 [Kofleriaceae bacterium]|jgi:hypothetical protein|nr:hypothetical protein [Kofleriaceae bacterium]